MTNKSLNTSRSLFVAVATTVLLAGLSLAFLRQQIAGRARETGRPTIYRSDSNDLQRASAHSSSVLSQAPTDKFLQQSIDDVIDSNDFPAGRWGVFVMGLRDGRVLYARDADRPFVPASNMKLYTTAVALDLLGSEYRWRTSVYARSSPDKNGIIDGNLTLYGRGAPDLSFAVHGEESSLRRLADDLYKNGVRHIRGQVVGDESYFRGEPLGDGWLWNDLQWYYGAEISALSIGGNEIGLFVAPGAKPGDRTQLKIEPPTQYVQVVNDAITVEAGTPATMGITRGLSDNVFRVWGDFPVKSAGVRARLAIHQPALLAARVFRDELSARGIIVDGDAMSTNAQGKQDNERFDTQSEVELASTAGTSLGEISRATNKESLNHEAELILRTLGKEKGYTALDSDPNKMSTRGDDAAGAAVIRRWLEQAGISTQSIAIHDGSGLSRLDMVTPEATARLLHAISKTSSARVFRDSLAIAGRDGTLRNRLRAESGRIFAKTGSLIYANSLSGYIVTDDGESLAFSIIYNGTDSATNSLIAIDKIAELIATRPKP